MNDSTFEVSPEQIADAEKNIIYDDGNIRPFIPEAEDVAPPCPKARYFHELQRRSINDPAILIGDSYLCRKNGLLFVGPSGIGKSSFIIQCMILWAIALDFLGIPPRFAIKSLLIQAENDDGDLAEMRDGVISGMGLTQEQIDLALQNILIVTEDARTAYEFTAFTLDPLLSEYAPDIVWIDPALAYLGGEASKQKDVGHFLRNLINPLIHKHNCAAVITHHTNKPSKGEEKAAWQAGELAYLGSGSIEWTNWARAIIGLQSIGSHTVFKLIAPKRGSRLHWTEEDEQTKSYSKLIAHSKLNGAICWHEATPDDMPEESPSQPGGRPNKVQEIATSNLHQFCAQCLPDGEGLNAISSRLESWLAEQRIDISIATAKRVIPLLVANSKLTKSPTGLYIKGPQA
jgi:hypothetical protein